MEVVKLDNSEEKEGFYTFKQHIFVFQTSYSVRSWLLCSWLCLVEDVEFDFYLNQYLGLTIC